MRRLATALAVPRRDARRAGASGHTIRATIRVIMFVEIIFHVP
jgi:hypothetical protein